MVIGILGQRFGLPTSDHESGTEEEFDWALKENQENGFPEIKWFFQDIETLKLPSDPEQATLALDQWKKVCAFKKRLSNGLLPIFYSKFPDLESFKAVLTKDLSLWLNDPDRHWHTQNAKSKKSANQRGSMLKSAAIVDYQLRLAEDTSKLHLIGLGQHMQIELPIEQAYIPLKALIDRAMVAKEVGRFNDERLCESDYADKDVDVSELFKRARQSGKRGVALLGDPGSGKTTAARQICWRLASGTETPTAVGLPENTIPVFLKLRDLCQGDVKDGLSAFLKRESHAETLASDISDPGSDLLNYKPLLWIFDGLDEVVNEDTRADVCTLIQTALKNRVHDFILVTSRYQGYYGKVNLGPSFLACHVQPLADTDVNDFVSCWYKTVCIQLLGNTDKANNEAESNSKSLLDLLGQSEFRIGRLRELRTNPLLLTILCTVHHQDHNLPRRRSSLYAKCIRVFLEYWRQEVREKQKLVRFEPEAAESVLASLSWWLHRQENRTSADEHEMEKEVEQFLVNISTDSGLGKNGQEFIARMRDECGIFVTTSPGRCGFLHLTFQEYLAAVYAESEHKVESLTNTIGQSWWREVILLTLGIGRGPFVRAFFQAILKDNLLESNSEFISQCIDEALHPVLDPFIEALNKPGTRVATKVAILRLLRDQDLPELAGICLELVDNKNQELAAFAGEIVVRQRSTLTVEQMQRADQLLHEESKVQIDEKTGIFFVNIPSGMFMMGSDESERERPVHSVQISTFMMGKSPVTNEEYGRFLKANVDYQVPEYWNNSRFNNPKQPVVGVSWDDTQAYCQWAGPSIRLPTEAEWEYACRAGTNTPFSLGDGKNFDSTLANFNGKYPYGNAKKGRYLGKTSEVDSYKANAWGLYDMHGNVFEWCQDRYGDYSAEDVSNPKGPAIGSGRVLRGGCWNLNAVDCRSANRDGIGPSNRSNLIGFRVVLAHRSGS